MSSIRLPIAALLSTVVACSSRPPEVTAPTTPAAAANANAAATARGRQEGDPGWPRAMEDAHGWRVTISQPQIDRVDGDQLAARVAVAAVPPRATPLYAVVALRARASIDKHDRIVTLDEVNVDRVQSAAPAAHGEELEAAMRRDLPPLLATLALDRLVAELASDGARIADGTPAVRNTPPRIIVATRLAVLVPVDGAPAWRRAGDRFDRVVNTRALIVRDRARKWIYLYVGDTWYRARSLAGDWRTAALLPSGLDSLRTQLVERAAVDLLDAPGSSLSRELALGHVPAIVVATDAAELIALDGRPTVEPIAGTNLSFATNTEADLFADGADERWYVLVSGRWFRAATLDGPWQFVAPRELPRDFARIPPSHDKARVLASVPGTELAAEALVAHELAETAIVRRGEATLHVRYDGPPRFAPLEGTVMRWAVNSATPVVELAAPLAGDGVYYALADGVWFSGASPDGPWRAASSLPAAIYQIPASAPLHFASYVHVYGGDDERVRVGYTPGYLGACRGSDGVVVFGTGIPYAPYIGSGWIGRPATYGFAARWEPRLGWTLGHDGGSARVVPSVVAAGRARGRRCRRAAVRRRARRSLRPLGRRRRAARAPAARLRGGARRRRSLRRRRRQRLSRARRRVGALGTRRLAAGDHRLAAGLGRQRSRSRRAARARA